MATAPFGSSSSEAPLPPPGELLLMVDDLVERYDLDRSCDSALRCSASARGCFDILTNVHSLQLDRADNPSARVIRELGKAGALIHGPEGSKSPKSGIVTWLDRITDRDRLRAISELSVAMIMVMIDEFCEEYKLDYACQKTLKFAVPCTEVASIIYNMTARDHTLLKASHNPSAYVMKELRGKTVTRERPSSMQDPYQPGRPLLRPLPTRERSRSPPGRGPPTGFDVPGPTGGGRFGPERNDRFSTRGPPMQSYSSSGPYPGKGSGKGGGGKGNGKGKGNGPPFMAGTANPYGVRGPSAPAPRRPGGRWS